MKDLDLLLNRTAALLQETMGDRTVEISWDVLQDLYLYLVEKCEADESLIETGDRLVEMLFDTDERMEKVVNNFKEQLDKIKIYGTKN